MQKIDQLLSTTQFSIAHPFEKGVEWCTNLNTFDVWSSKLF
jgi:hypothetical protein